MANYRNRNWEAKERQAERRRREAEAGRLIDRVPSLKSLSFQVQEHGVNGPLGDSKYVRRIPLPHAPALLIMPCTDNQCEDGGHDVTREVLSALMAGETSFQGSDPCHGHTRAASCTRVLRYVAEATYE
ncbi:MAG: hypothetical protein R3B13_33290 [Polyangiaceae bacterium]